MNPFGHGGAIDVADVDERVNPAGIVDERDVPVEPWGAPGEAAEGQDGAALPDGPIDDVGTKCSPPVLPVGSRATSTEPRTRRG